MKHIKHQKIVTLGAMLALALSFVTAGCGHTLSRTKETRVSNDGTVSTKERTVTENPDGTITRTETRKTDRP